MSTTDNYRPYAYPQEWYDEVAEMNIYQRLHGAMADAKPVAKTTKDGIKFKFHGHEGVSAMVKALAEKWRFVMESTVMDHKLEITEIYGKARPLCILTVRVRFINIDKPAEFSEAMTVGYGVDESDKGPGKALSYALKMAQLKAFLIHDGEKLDNEEFSYQHEREEKALANAKQRWANACKRFKLDMKVEGERLKATCGGIPQVEDIIDDARQIEQLHGESKVIQIPDRKKPAPAPAPVPAPAEPETVDDVNPVINDDPEREEMLDMFPGTTPKPSFVDQG